LLEALRKGRRRMRQQGRKHGIVELDYIEGDPPVRVRLRDDVPAQR